MMDVKAMFLGTASKEESRRFWGIANAVGFACMAATGLNQSLFHSDFRVYEIGIAITLAGFALSLASFLMKPSPPPAVEVGLRVVVGLVVAGFLTSQLGISQSLDLSIPSLGFLIVVSSLIPTAYTYLQGNRGSRLAGAQNSSSSLTGQSSINPDAMLYLAIGGAAAICLSLLVLPWFSLEGIDWGNSASITFNDLRDLYNFAKDNGLNGDVRFFYLEWGYIVSFVVAIIGAVISLRLRDGKTVVTDSILKIAIGATALVGLWQGVLATALTQLDDEGKVQFGVWLGVLGHVALVLAFVLQLRIVKERAGRQG